MSVSCRYLLKCPLSDWGSSLFFCLQRVFLLWMGMEFCKCLFFLVSFEMISWFFFLLSQYGILHWFFNVKPNFISEITPTCSLCIIFYIAKFNLLQSKEFYSYIHVGVDLQFSFFITVFSNYGIKAILLQGTRWGVPPPMLQRSLCTTNISYALMDGRNHQWGHLGRQFLCVNNFN